MDAAISGASPAGHDGKGFWREAVNPLVRSDGLMGLRIGSESGPISFFLDLFVWDGALHHQDERIEPAGFSVVPILQKIVAHFVGQHGIVKVHLG